MQSSVERSGFVAGFPWTRVRDVLLFVVLFCISSSLPLQPDLVGAQLQAEKGRRSDDCLIDLKSAKEDINSGGLIGRVVSMMMHSRAQTKLKML